MIGVEVACRLEQPQVEQRRVQLAQRRAAQHPDQCGRRTPAWPFNQGYSLTGRARLDRHGRTVDGHDEAIRQGEKAEIGIFGVIGPPAIAVLLAEIILNLTSMFNHGNIGIPSKVDAVLRLFLVTPDMHRVHHSCVPEETNSNFGFNFPWWDRLFGSYRAQPAKGHTGMEIGIKGLREIEQQRLDRLLLQPLGR